MKSVDPTIGRVAVQLPEMGGSDVMKIKLAAAMAAMVGLSLLAAPVAHAEASADSECPSGAVCIFNGESLDSGVDLMFWSYGAHNLSNVYGKRLWINNQYGSPQPWAYICRGYDGKGGTIAAIGTGGLINDFTPVNSVIVGRPGGYPGDGCQS